MNGGGSSPGPPGHPCAFPMVFVVVVVVVVVVALVEFERGSGPVSGFGCTRSFSGVHLCCFVCISKVLAISCKKHGINVTGSTGP